MAQNAGIERRMLVTLTLFAVAAVVLVAVLRPGLIRFWPFSVTDFVQLMTPLILVSLFIERALEVNKPAAKDTLMKVGGFEIGGIAGLVLGCAALGLPVLCNVSSDAWVGRKHQPVLTQDERGHVIDAFRDVAFTHLSCTGTEEVLRLLRPRIYAKGVDWEGRLPAEQQEICAEHGIEIAFLDTVLRSSTAILERYRAGHGPLQIPLLVGVLPLHNARHAAFLHNEVPGIEIPPSVLHRFEREGNDGSALGRRLAVDLLEEISELAQGTYLMPAFGRYEHTAEVIEALSAVRQRRIIGQP